MNRSVMIVLALALLAQPLEAAADKKAVNGGGKPIITTEVVYNTVELLNDVRVKATSFVLTHPAVKDHYANIQRAIEAQLAQLGPDPLDALYKKAGVQKKDVTDVLDKGFATFTQVRATVTESLTLATDPLNSGVGAIVDAFDAAVPEHAGAIPRSLQDFVLFAAYLLVVVYILFRLFFFFFRLFTGIFCFVFCCGVCRSKRGTSAKAAKHAAKRADAAKTPAAAKPKAKAAGKK